MTPDQRLRQHRRQARFGGAVVIALTVLIIGLASVTGGGKESASAGAIAPDPAASAASARPAASPGSRGYAAPSPGPAARSWYQALATARTRVVTTAAAVRRFVAAQDGSSLRPACVALGTAAADARGAAAGPDPDLDRLWRQGASYYAGAATWCAQLFDGTRIAVTQLQARTLNSLDLGDGQWADLGRRLGGQDAPGSGPPSSVPPATVPPVTVPPPPRAPSGPPAAGSSGT